MDKEIKHEQAIASLESTGNYKILYKYEKPKYYHQDDGLKKLKGIFIDVETTGLSHEIDKIIEIALVPFEFSKDGRIFKLLDGYSSLEDPKTTLPQKLISLTGITNEMLNGKSFNDDEIDLRELFHILFQLGMYHLMFYSLNQPIHHYYF